MSKDIIALTPETARKVKDLIARFHKSSDNKSSLQKRSKRQAPYLAHVLCGAQEDSFPMYAATVQSFVGSTRSVVSYPAQIYLIDANSRRLIPGTRYLAESYGDYGGFSLWVAEAKASFAGQEDEDIEPDDPDFGDEAPCEIVTCFPADTSECDENGNRIITRRWYRWTPGGFLSAPSAEECAAGCGGSGSGGGGSGCQCDDADDTYTITFGPSDFTDGFCDCDVWNDQEITLTRSESLNCLWEGDGISMMATSPTSWMLSIEVSCGGLPGAMTYRASNVDECCDIVFVPDSVLSCGTYPASITAVCGSTTGEGCDCDEYDGDFELTFAADAFSDGGTANCECEILNGLTITLEKQQNDCFWYWRTEDPGDIVEVLLLGFLPTAWEIIIGFECGDLVYENADVTSCCPSIEFTERIVDPEDPSVCDTKPETLTVTPVEGC